MHPETPLATDPFPVLAVVEVGDQWGIYCRIVGVAVVVDQLPPDFGGRSIEVIDRRRIEDPVGIGAVVGRAIAIPRENRVHLRAGILTVQIRHRLGRTLTGTHHRDAAGGTSKASSLCSSWLLCHCRAVGLIPEGIAGNVPQPNTRARARIRRSGREPIVSCSRTSNPSEVASIPVILDE